MNGELLQHFIQLIATHTGLHIRDQDRQSLASKIYDRMQLLNISSVDNYYQLLNDSNKKTSSSVETPSEREWKELALQLTIGESYFFRDRGQIGLLNNTILPKLIEQKRQAYILNPHEKLSLRIWSAGCSTGEEAYSLAILVKELIPDMHKWQILILGTDLNLQAIAKAKRGIYESWSFRMVDPLIKQTYFKQRQQSWEIHEQIRSTVKFQANNLIKDSYPNSASDIQKMDIIICRNVFIYFDANSIAIVLDKFYQTLKTGGYLITGHAELHGQNLGKFHTKVFPESLVYQRDEAARSEAPKQPIQLFPLLVNPPSQQTNKDSTITKDNLKSGLSAQLTQRSPVNASSIAVERIAVQSKTDLTNLSNAQMLFNQGKYAQAIHAAEQVLAHQSERFAACYLIAQALANLGESERAAAYCQKAIEIDALSIAPYYLLAHIAEEKGHIDRAKELFKQIIYLDATAVIAYIEIGIIYEREGDAGRAKKMWSAARELLIGLPSHSIVKPGETTVSELEIYLNNLLTKYL